MESSRAGPEPTYLQHARNWFAAFEDLRLEPEEFLDLGDRYLVTMQLSGHGSGSGVAVSEQMFQLFFRDGVWWSGRRTSGIARGPSKPPASSVRDAAPRVPADKRLAEAAER
jgi:hypothetical protein